MTKQKKVNERKPNDGDTSDYGNCAGCGRELMSGEADQHGYCEDCSAEYDEDEIEGANQ